MRVIIHKTHLEVRREKSDPKLRPGGWAGGWAPEHRLLYWVKQDLIRRGWDVIKTTAGRDGHLMADELPMLRSRKPGCPGPKGGIIVWNGSYQVRGVEDDWNGDGVVRLDRASAWK